MALQVLAPTQVAVTQGLVADAPVAPSVFSPGAPAANPEASCNACVLQEFVHPQDPLLVGLIAIILGGALQESFVPFTQQLVERGRRVLAQNRGGPGLPVAAQTTH